jgi:hypothetical protein
MRGLGFHLYEDLQNQPSKAGNSYGVVTRGELCTTIPQQWSNIRTIAEKETILVLKQYVNDLKDSGDFSMVLHTNTYGYESV